MDTRQLIVKGGSFLVSEIDESSVFTPEDFTDEHKLIASTTAQFVAKEVEPKLDAIENQDFNEVVALLHKAGELGVLAHSIPSSYGGLELDKITKAIVGEQIGRTGAYGVAHSNHTCIATLPITYFGTEEQKQKYLPKLASGEYLGAYCLTEPEAGSDALASRTTAVLNDEGTYYRLNGTKIFITNAEFADTFIVYAKVNGEKFTAFIVERGYSGLSLGPEEEKMGIKGSSTRSVFFEDCLVPVENVLGEIGKGHVIALNVLNLGRFNLGAACMGGAKHTLQKAIAYTSLRKQFGKPLAEFGATMEKIATMASRIYAAESLQYRTAGLIEDALGDLYNGNDQRLIGRLLAEYAIECAICKVYGSETLDSVVDETLQLFGGAGFIKDYGVERIYRDSRINRIFEGTNEINRLLIPTQLFRKIAKGEIGVGFQLPELLASFNELTFNSEVPLTREEQAVHAIRRLFLLFSGMAFAKYGEGLLAEQEIAMKLSDLAISLYACESAVIRTKKAIKRNGLENEELKLLLTQAYLDDVLVEVDSITKLLAIGMLDGEKLQQIIRLSSRVVGSFLTGGAKERKRAIASHYFKFNTVTNEH